MTTRTLHVTPRAGGSCALMRRIGRSPGKGAVRRHQKRATPSPVHRTMPVDCTGLTRVARLTAPSRPTQSA